MWMMTLQVLNVRPYIGGKKFASMWKKKTGMAGAQSGDRSMVEGGEAWAGLGVGAAAGVGPAAAAAATAAAAGASTRPFFSST